MIRRTRAAVALSALLAGCTPEAADPPPAPPAQAAQTLAPRDTAAHRRAQRTADVSHRRQTMPRHEDYPARDTFSGTPAPVDFASAADARRLRTVLREGAARGPNFAGHYALVQWGCGSACQSFAIVDLRTVRVTFTPRPLSVGADYRLDSELLVVDPPEGWLESYGADATDAVGGNAASYYYRWDGRRLILLDSLAIGSNVRW